MNLGNRINKNTLPWWKVISYYYHRNCTLRLYAFMREAFNGSDQSIMYSNHISRTRPQRQTWSQISCGVPDGKDPALIRYDRGSPEVKCFNGFHRKWRGLTELESTLEFSIKRWMQCILAGCDQCRS